MTKKAICTENKALAYYSGFSGLEIHKIENGIDEYVYFTAGAWGGGISYHKSKIYYNNARGGYFKFNGLKIYFDECIKM